MFVECQSRSDVRICHNALLSEKPDYYVLHIRLGSLVFIDYSNELYVRSVLFTHTHNAPQMNSIPKEAE